MSEYSRRTFLIGYDDEKGRRECRKKKYARLERVNQLRVAHFGDDRAAEPLRPAVRNVPPPPRAPSHTIQLQHTVTTPSIRSAVLHTSSRLLIQHDDTVKLILFPMGSILFFYTT